jgi:hypothetical protein
MFLFPYLLLPFMIIFSRKACIVFVNTSCAILFAFLIMQYL